VDVDNGYMRIAIRVRPGPGPARLGVGGAHDGALIVRVSAQAVDGKATATALAAVAGDPHILAALLAVPSRRPGDTMAAVRPSDITDLPIRAKLRVPAQLPTKDGLLHTAEYLRDVC
jgi:hypothetical protein